ncbi:MAG: glycosyltransferase family 4 protein [Bacteroidales bacterium]
MLQLFNYPQHRIEFHYALLKKGSLISRLKSDHNRYYELYRRRKIDFKVLRYLRKIVRENGIQIVHTHQLIELIYALLLKFSNPGIKIFHTIHGYHDANSLRVEKLEQFLVRFTTKTFTVSVSTREILLKKGYPGRKLEVLYNAVSPPLKPEPGCVENFKKRINYNKTDFIVGMIGNFVWWKDQLTIIRAYTLLKKEMPLLKVVFIGKESSLSLKCKNQLESEDLDKRVFFLGPVDNAASLLGLFDLFVMSTLMDTFGIVVIEALLSKTPVLASDIGVMKELSHNGEYFALFKKQNAADLAEKIRLFYHRIITENNIKIENSYEHAITAFSFEKYIELLVKYYSCL